MRESFGFNPIATPAGTVQIVPNATATMTRTNVKLVTVPTCSQSPLVSSINNVMMLHTPHPTPANVAAAASQPNPLRSHLPASIPVGAGSARTTVSPLAVARAAGGVGVASATNGIQTFESTQRSNFDF